jgi:hypothetical protein
MSSPPIQNPEPRIGRWCRLLAVLAFATVLSGCAGMVNRPPPLTIEQVVQMAKDGSPAAEINKEIDRTRTVLPLNGSQYAKLKQDGVPDEVLDHLQNRYLRAVEFDARMRYQNMYWGGGWGWGWGPPYPYRPFPGHFPYWYW